MARDQGHGIEGRLVEIGARILHVVDGATRLLGEVERAGDPARNLVLDTEGASSAVSLSILVPDGTDLSALGARLSRHPAVAGAQVGAPS